MAQNCKHTEGTDSDGFCNICRARVKIILDLADPRQPDPSVMPRGQGKRDRKRPNYNYIPIEFDDQLAEVFEEGRRPRPGMPEGYGDSWMKGGDEFLLDCLNHAHWHLKMHMRGDRSENHLAKVAWNVLAVRYHELRIEEHKRNHARDQETKGHPGRD